jgi:RHH-type rel operon transcriptional repressor/antitoxin RelB
MHPTIGAAMSRQTAIRLPDETYERLQILASRTGRTASHYIREAIEEHLTDIEDVYLAERTLERVRKGKELTYSLDDVEHQLGLAD